MAVRNGNQLALDNCPFFSRLATDRGRNSGIGRHFSCTFVGYLCFLNQSLLWLVLLFFNIKGDQSKNTASSKRI